MGNNRLIEVANNTLDIFDKGYYMFRIDDKNSVVAISYLDNNASQEAILIKEHHDVMKCKITHKKYSTPASILVLNQPVTEVIVNSKNKYGVLNFASAYHAGGGFLRGSMAQEESLCYCSNLYYLQLNFEQEFYRYNKQVKSKCYTDRMIYTPNTVFIKDSSYHILSQPILANILTSPAVNLAAALNNKESKNDCLKIMKDRMRMILSVFANKGNERIILGAFGCGVFKNDPEIIAEYWRELLEEGYLHQFKEIIFAVYDTSVNLNMFSTFESVLAI